MKRTAVRLNINRVRETIGCGGQDIHFIARVVSEKRPLNNTSRSTCPTPITWSSSNIGDKSIAPTTDYPIPQGRSGDTQSVKSPGHIDYPLSAGLGFLVDNEELREDRTTARPREGRCGVSEGYVSLGFRFPGGNNLQLRLRSRRLSSSRCRERAFSKSLSDTRPRNLLVARASTGIRVQPFSAMRYTTTRSGSSRDTSPA